MNVQTYNNVKYLRRVPCCGGEEPAVPKKKTRYQIILSF
jgi:hypothetical protein